MKFDIMTVGKIKPGFFYEGEKEYLKRLQRYIKTTCTIIKAEKISQSTNDEIVKQRESQRIIEKLASGDFIVALDKSGTLIKSEQLSNKIEQWQMNGRQRIVFIIGGAVGLSNAIINKADFVLSMSTMTFQHDMAKLILLEQLYRAFTIIRSEKYHK